MKWEKPIRHMLDYLDVLQPLLETGRRATRARCGATSAAAGVRPRAAEGDARRARRADAEDRRPPHRRHDPVVRRPDDAERQIVPIINAAANFAGRPTPSDGVQPAGVGDDDPAPAREFLGAILDDYATLPSYRAMLDIEGVKASTTSADRNRADV